MISIVTWLWDDPHLQPPKLQKQPRPAPGEPEMRLDMQPSYRLRRRNGLPYPRRPVYRSPESQTQNPIRPARSFKPEHVNVMQKMFARCLPQKHRFICIADSNDGLSPDVEFLETPATARKVAACRSPEGPRFPSCYRRLWSFSPEATILGDRILVCDIDLILSRDITPIIDRSEDFVGWRPFRDWGRKLRFGGGIYLLKTGSRPKVWTDFDGNPSIHAARTAGFRGSDQAWISYKLAEKEPYWSKSSGIYSIRDLGPDHRLPPDARLVQFNGNSKPWDYRGRGAGWVAQHWR